MLFDSQSGGTAYTADVNIKETQPLFLAFYSDLSIAVSLNWRSSPAFYVVPEKIQGWTGPKSIQTPVPFHPPAGRNPDWGRLINRFRP